MDTKIKKLDGSKKELTVTITKEEMANYISTASKEISQHKEIKGFRKGKAPQEVVESNVGSDYLFSQAAEVAIRETYPQIISENDLYTISNPNVEIITCSPGEDLVYKAVVYVFPEVNLPDYKKIAKETAEKESSTIKIEDKEIDEAIEMVRSMKSKKIAVPRGAEKNDLVTVDIAGYAEDDKEKKIEEKGVQFVLGKGDSDILQGFEENLYGLKAGEEKSFSLEMPDIDEKGKEIDKKKKMEITATMKTVMTVELPELNDEFAKEFQVADISSLREKIKEDIKKEKEGRENEKIKSKVLQEISNKTKLELPEILVEKELDNMMKSAENQLAQRGSSFDAYLEEANTTVDKLRKSWKKQAEENVSYAIILHKIGTEEKIEVSEKEIEEEMNKHFIATGKSKDSFSKENIERMEAYVYDVLKNKKTFAILSVE